MSSRRRRGSRRPQRGWKYGKTSDLYCCASSLFCVSIPIPFLLFPLLLLHPLWAGHRRRHVLLFLVSSGAPVSVFANRYYTPNACRFVFDSCASNSVASVNAVPTISLRHTIHRSWLYCRWVAGRTFLYGRKAGCRFQWKLISASSRRLVPIHGDIAIVLTPLLPLLSLPFVRCCPLSKTDSSLSMYIRICLLLANSALCSLLDIDEQYANTRTIAYE